MRRDWKLRSTITSEHCLANKQREHYLSLQNTSIWVLHMTLDI